MINDNPILEEGRPKVVRVNERQPVKTLVEAIREATTRLPTDVIEALQHARDADDPNGRTQLDAILENVDIACRDALPLCQDTGIPTFLVRAGFRFPYLDELPQWIDEAVRLATAEVPLRPNVVDLLTNRNTGNNTGRGIPAITWELVPGAGCRIDILPKGGGSENCSALRMLSPADGMKGVKLFVVDHIASCGGRPCPPGIIGVGLGGGADVAMKLAKRSLFRPVGERHPAPQIAQLEVELLELINATGVGPMGLGGRITALDVHIEIADRHPASLPVGIAYQCWADRRAAITINASRRATLIRPREQGSEVGE
jgi:fumarate hydratase subunit alpha